MYDVHRLCKHYIQQNKALPYEVAYELGQASVEAAISGESILTIDTTALLTGLYNKATLTHEDAPAMIAGLCAAVFHHDIGKSPQGFLTVEGVGYAMENCGMGGDTISTANISCLSALCAASAGLTMIKHGSRGHTNPSGSSDFFERCGIPLDLDVSEIQSLVRKYKLGYIDAVDVRFKRIHLQTMARASVSHLNHIVGPITSPVHPPLLRRRIIGINQVIDPMVIARAYDILNLKGVTQVEHLLLVRGRGENKGDSMDEVSIAEAGTELVTLRQGEITSRMMHASEFGLQTAPFDSVRIPTGREKGDFSMAILQGEIDGPAADLVYANAALLFYLDDPSRSLQDCAQSAREQLRSGKAYQHIQAIRRFLGR